MKVVKMDSIAIPCTDLNSAKKIWDELASDQNIKDTVSSKKLINSLPRLMSDLKTEELSGIFKTRHIHGNINFEQFLCLVAALGDNPNFKALVAFNHLSSDNGKTVNEEDMIKIANLIIPDINIVKQIFSKVDASGLGEATKDDFINFLPSEIDTNSQLFSVIHKMEDASFGNEKKNTTPEKLESDPKILDNTGTSPLQLQIGFFRLVQGAAYRCFRASYTANSETHLRAYNLPYSITSFVSFVGRITQLYIDSGVIENNVIREAEKLCEIVTAEYESLKNRIQNWESIDKDSHMLLAENLLENELLETEDEHQLFLSIVEMVLSIGIDGENHFSIDHSEMAMNEINRLRLKEELTELDKLSKSKSNLNSINENFIDSWQRVIVDEADTHVAGSIMPVKFWYEEFMPQLLKVCSAHTNDELQKLEQETEEDLNNWFQISSSNGDFTPYALDLNEQFSNNSLDIKKRLKQAWRLSEHYLNGVQKRREREEFGRNDGYLCEYVTFIDVYLDRNDIQLSEMRISFPYYIGPATWRFMHTMGEIACNKKSSQEDFIEDFKSFFRSLATVYPCPYCRYHLNRYVVQNKEIQRYPLEYLFLGFKNEKMDLTISLEDKLDTINSPEQMRLFIWKLHNTVSSSIARSEEWFNTEKDPLYTNRYWPSLDTELERAHAFSKISIELARVYKVYNMLHPVSKLQTLRDEIKYAIETTNKELFDRCKERFKGTLEELEKEILGSGFLQDTYHYNPSLIDVPPHFTPEDEAYSRSGHFYEN